MAVTCCDCALGALSELAEGKVVASQQKQAPHLRWSQAPPLPWRRPGSADYYVVVVVAVSVAAAAAANAAAAAAAVVGLAFVALVFGALRLQWRS